MIVSIDYDNLRTLCDNFNTSLNASIIIDVMCVCAFLLTDAEISPQDLFKQSVDEDQMYETPGAVTYVSLTIIHSL